MSIDELLKEKRQDILRIAAQHGAYNVRPMRTRVDYRTYGLGLEHIPHLIRMALDEELYWSDSDSLEVWAPIHACHALGQQRAVESTPVIERAFAAGCVDISASGDWEIVGSTVSAYRKPL